jgi:hypothetical protein
VGKKTTNEKPVPPIPLKFEDAVAAALETKPEPKPKKKPAKDGGLKNIKKST